MNLGRIQLLPHDWLKMDNGEEAKLQCLNPNLLPENPPLPELDFLSTDPPSSLAPRNKFLSSEPHVRVQCQPPTPQLCLKEVDAFLYPAFHSAKVFHPKSRFSLHSDGVKSLPG